MWAQQDFSERLAIFYITHESVNSYNKKINRLSISRKISQKLLN